MTRKHTRRWLLPHLPKQTLRFLAARVERLVERGLTFEAAMDRVTAPLR